MLVLNSVPTSGRNAILYGLAICRLRIWKSYFVKVFQEVCVRRSVMVDVTWIWSWDGACVCFGLLNQGLGFRCSWVRGGGEIPRRWTSKEMQVLRAEAEATSALGVWLARPPQLQRKQRRGSGLSCKEQMQTSGACLTTFPIFWRLLG